MIKLQDKINEGATDKDPTVLHPCESDIIRRKFYKYGNVIGLNKVVSSQFDSRQLMEARLRENESCVKYEWNDGLFRRVQLCYSNTANGPKWDGEVGGPLVAKPQRRVRCLIGISTFNHACSSDRTCYQNEFTSAIVLRNWIWRQICLLNKL